MWPPKPKPTSTEIIQHTHSCLISSTFSKILFLLKKNFDANSTGIVVLSLDLWARGSRQWGANEVQTFWKHQVTGCYAIIDYPRSKKETKFTIPMLPPITAESITTTWRNTELVLLHQGSLFLQPNRHFKCLWFQDQHVIRSVEH